jgi:DNA-binding beta-propeller fold protein YncE/GH35 family endo-1,4-beta-xylanase
LEYPYGLVVAPDGTVYVADTYNHRIQRFTATGEFLGTWGAYGFSNGQFCRPWDVAVAPDGTVYVVDTDNHRIQHFTAMGTFLGTWGSQGWGNGQFNRPTGVEVAPGGTVYVADSGNNRIQRFTATGDFLSAWGYWGWGNGQFNDPHGVAVAPDSTVYVADTDDHRIQRFTAMGDFLGAWGSWGHGNGQFSRPTGVAVAPDSAVYVADTDNNRIQRFTATGSFLGTWGSYGSGNGQFNGPWGVAVAPDGTVYVADTYYNSRIQRFTATGDFLGTWGSYGSGNGQFYYPSGVAVAPDGTVYVADTDNHRTQRFTATGDFLGTCGTWGSGNGQFRKPWSVAVAPDGTVYIVDGGNRIQRFTATGDFLGTWGSEGWHHGQFDNPYGVAVALDGTVYVADSGNKRIQAFGTTYPDTWRGEYFGNRWLAEQPLLIRQDTAVDFDWGSASPGGGMPADNFSARWQRYIWFDARSYRFTVQADDGVRLWVDDQLLIEHWLNPQAATFNADVSLSTGYHLVRLEYYEAQGNADVHLSWAATPVAHVYLPLVIKNYPAAPTHTPTATSIPTATSTPTLPPTLTPVPPTATPTPPGPVYTPVPISPEDAAALAQAIQDIPRYRQGDLEIMIQDADGRPLEGFTVQYQQVKHNFLFGTSDDPPSRIRYFHDAGTNAMTLNLWWTLVEPEAGDFQLDFVNFYRNIEELSSGRIALKAQGMLVFGSSQATDIPDYLHGLPFSDLLGTVERHMSNTARRYAAQIDRWEASLEPNFVSQNPLGLTREQYLQVIATSANSIRANDPDAKIEINFCYPCGGIPWLDNQETLRQILAYGIDFDAVGLQFYYNGYIQYPSPYEMTRMSLSQISSCIDGYEAMLTPYGKSIAASEISVPSETPYSQIGYWGYPWSEDLQAQYLTVAYTIFFSKARNSGITWWSGVEPGSFVWKGGLVDETGRPKKAYWALRNLINSWTTSGNGVTGDDGALQIRGYGGGYNLVITDPSTGTRMQTQVEIAEQQSQTVTLVFAPDNYLIELRDKLAALVGYWEAQHDLARVQKGKDYLALADYHLTRSERDRAEQTLNAGIVDLAITRETHLTGLQLLGSVGYRGYGYTREKSSALIWSGSTLYYPYEFPRGKVKVDVVARGRQASGVWPRMVIGVGANYSEPFTVDNSTNKVYSFTSPVSGDERVLTIRFLYADNANPGEWKLYVDGVTMTIQTDQVPEP